MVVNILNRSLIVLGGLTLALLFLIKLVWAVAIPPAFDEAYYIDWARHLSWGYLDHPPGVALLSYLGHSNNVYLLARLPSFLLSALAIFPLYNICRIVGMKDLTKIISALLLFFGSVTGVAFGAMTLPDSGLMFFWILALQELLRAIEGRNEAWLTLGFAVGLGFLCKYIMILFLPVIFLSVLNEQPAILKKSAIWAGFACFLLVISPHLAWNADQDWRSFKFQFQRGLQNSHEQSQAIGQLPERQMQPSYEDLALASRLLDPLDLEKKPKERTKTAIEKFLGRTSEYFFGVALIWGLVGLYIIYAIARRRVLQPVQSKPLLYGAVVPLAFFGLISLFTKTEGNWASIYTCAAAPLLVMTLPISLRFILLASIGNVMVYSGLIFYMLFQTGPISAKRAFKETGAYEQLFHYVSQNSAYPIFTERYQIAAQLNYFAKQPISHQFPGFQRVSEYIFSQESPQVQNRFALVTETFPPPSFASYKLESMFEFRKCADGQTQWRAAVVQDVAPICRQKEKVQVIYLANYRKKTHLSKP